MATTTTAPVDQQPNDMTHVKEVNKENSAAASIDFTKMNIYQKMMYVRKNIGPIHKSLNVVSEDNSDRYKGVAAADIITPIEKLLEQVGIFKIPGDIDYQVNGRLTTQRQAYRFVNIDNPAEEILAHASGQGFDMADKGINAASTNAIKYLYMRMFGLMAENEDPEAIHSMDKVYNANQMTPPPQMGQTQQVPQQAPVAPYQQAPQYQQPQHAYMQQPEPVVQESPEASRFKGLVEELSKCNIPNDSLFNYLNTQLNPSNPLDFNRPELIEREVLHTINENLVKILAPYQNAAAAQAQNAATPA